jgi:hypothetical protein
MGGLPSLLKMGGLPIQIHDRLNCAQKEVAQAKLCANTAVFFGIVKMGASQKKIDIQVAILGVPNL